MNEDSDQHAKGEFKHHRRRAKMNRRPPPDDDRVAGLALLIWQERWFVALSSIAGLALGAIFAFGLSVPRYSATADLAFQTRSQPIVDLTKMVSGLPAEQAAINTELEMIRTPSLMAELVAELDLMSDPEFNAQLSPAAPMSAVSIRRGLSALLGRPVEAPAPSEDDIRDSVIAALRGAVTVSGQRNTYVFNIRATTTDPDKSVRIANALALLYLDRQLSTKLHANEEAVSWLSARVSELEQELKIKQAALDDLRSDSDLVSSRALDALNARYKELRDRRSAETARMEGTIARLARLDARILAKDFDGIADELGDQLLDRNLVLVRAGQVGAEADFLVRANRLADTLREQRARSERQHSALTEAMTQMQSRLREQTDDLRTLSTLERDVQTTQVLYDTFVSRLKTSSLHLGLQQADSRILSLATRGAKVAPRAGRILVVSLILGFLAGAAFLVIRQMTRTSFRNAADLRDAAGLPVIGQIPLLPVRRRAKLIAFARANPTAPAVEAVRNLRTSLLMANPADPPKVIMSCSALPDEGKTTQAILLAMNFAGLGKRVLLIEGDIRRRTLGAYFSIPQKQGLVSLLKGAADLRQTIAHDDVSGVDVLMSEPSEISAADLYDGSAFEALMDELRPRYDYVILDMPPVLVVPDARIAARHVDAVLFAVRWNRTARQQVLEGLQQFGSVNAPVAGLVLTAVDPRRMRRDGYMAGYGAYADHGDGYYGT